MLYQPLLGKYIFRKLGNCNGIKKAVRVVDSQILCSVINHDLHDKAGGMKQVAVRLKDPIRPWGQMFGSESSSKIPEN